MKTAVLIFSFLCLSLPLSAQSAGDLEATIQKFRSALLAEDAATLRNLTSENLSYGHSAGMIENQEEFVAVFEAKNTDYQIWEVSDQTIEFHGKDLAIVRQNVKAEILSLTNQTTNSLNMGLMMIWVKEKSGWKLLARQSFRYPQT
ncbi:nuclear transport factor 2 family protein [Algoriphagus litoralis]|uniref:nuclear transport factor 2 family protein n=1 Tax=Algoriphagus litoralis TaxID=2202829 RepID=UPI000DBA59FF|nr:nuclear transport factor 2 family protein [Algoriphagus litoralis]